MKKIITSILLLSVATFGFSSGGELSLDHADIDLSDKESLQRGARNYMNYCYGCHSLDSVRYNRIAKDLGISEEDMGEFLIFDESKFGSLMENAIVDSDAKKWFGATPPDLTMINRIKGTPDWVYTYLKGFYQDDSRPWGVNNTVFPDVGMPHVLYELQGLCGHPPVGDSHVRYDSLSEYQTHEGGCEEYVSKGSLSPEEFDEFVLDLTNFIAYTGEPWKLKSHAIGKWVLFYLFILLLFSVAYYRELWKDVH
ncbi:cytochrome c1 [Marinicellulosiphila megalodicopiae]|uniref:cytochrome c1 n=1 Tax=Marinicellulosiphila megalodicopiae TaxID=2724896 RepID=UPI003BB0EB20